MVKIADAITPESRRQVRDAVSGQVVNLGGVYVPIVLKKAKADEKDDGRLYFEGYANTVNLDRTGDIVEPKAFNRSLKGYLKNNPQLLYMHDWYHSIGSIVEARVDQKGLWVRGFVQPATDDKGEELTGSWGQYIKFIRGQVKRGQIRTLSIGFRILDSKEGKAIDPLTRKERKVRIITQVELLENSLVTIPANRESVVHAKSWIEERYGEEVAKSLVLEEDESPEHKSPEPEWTPEYCAAMLDSDPDFKAAMQTLLGEEDEETKTPEGEPGADQDDSVVRDADGREFKLVDPKDDQPRYVIVEP